MRAHVTFTFDMPDKPNPAILKLARLPEAQYWIGLTEGQQKAYVRKHLSAFVNRIRTTDVPTDSIRLEWAS